MSRKSNQNRTKAILVILMIAMIAATVLFIWLSIDLVNQPIDAPSSGGSNISLPTRQPAQEQTEPTATTEAGPVPEHVVSTATIGSQGDLLMHIGLFSDKAPYYSVNAKADGTFNFDSIFRYLTEYTSAYDYMLANLETTFGGDDFPYQGNPTFNCHDELTDALVKAGYDMLLTANNHCADTLLSGIKRTLEVTRAAGLATTGTRLTGDEPRYSIVEVNGIQVGMACYTYTLRMDDNGRPSLNGGIGVKQPELVNYFSYNNLNGFYSQVETLLADMEAAGAEATMFFIHWGTEYEIVENATQNAIAQKLCDMGIDVIVGGHPHVVQPIELLESTIDPEQKTVCIYSLGNAVSNQRIAEMRLKTGHTEDGVLFTVTFEKYSDGTVYLADADVLPTWVDMHERNGGREYNILPLDYARADEWASLFGIGEETLTNAKKSYDRTMAIVGDGLTEVDTYLTQQKEEREQYYYDLAYSEG